ncbi:endoplasmic oxidoreductin-1 [Nowakowskiella sp. JEL0407]|nr:endoplasmic oxidoreductin-1 [Nowakowskiella sp. JEL0407]
MYFTYAVVLRAIKKLTPYLIKFNYCTGSDDETLKVENLVNQITSTSQNCPETFDEHQLFTSPEAPELMEQFKKNFRNVSRIMDCVGCEKCRLWGKLQVTGLGTALKVLFSYSESTVDYRLTRNELVAIFNAFFRLSESIAAVDEFRTMFRKRQLEKAEQQTLEVTTEQEKIPTTSDTFARSDPAKETTLLKSAGRGESDEASTSPVTKPVQSAEESISLPFDLSNTWISEPKNLLTFSLGAVIAVLGLIRILYKGYQIETGAIRFPEPKYDSNGDRIEKDDDEENIPKSKQHQKRHKNKNRVRKVK